MVVHGGMAVYAMCGIWYIRYIGICTYVVYGMCGMWYMGGVCMCDVWYCTSRMVWYRTCYARITTCVMCDICVLWYIACIVYVIYDICGGTWYVGCYMVVQGYTPLLTMYIGTYMVFPWFTWGFNHVIEGMIHVHTQVCTCTGGGIWVVYVHLIYMYYTSTHAVCTRNACLSCDAMCVTRVLGVLCDMRDMRICGIWGVCGIPWYRGIFTLWPYVIVTYLYLCV